MPRKIKIEPLETRNWQLLIRSNEGQQVWCVQQKESLAVSAFYCNMIEYARIKKVWRKNKERFDMICAGLPLHDLFNRCL